MAIATQKVRKMFPKKGVERKTLKFASNVSRISKEKRISAIKKFLRTKSAQEKMVAKKVLRSYKNRAPVFSTFEKLVIEFRKKNPSFEGVIIFGGTVKKHSPPTDLDFVFVGNLPQSEKKRFCNLLTHHTKIPANPFPVKIDIKNNPRAFDSLLSVPYLHGPEEWTIQNFVGPLSTKRLLNKSFKGALKRVKPKRIVN